MNIEKQSPGRVAVLGSVYLAPGQLVHEPGIDRSKGQLSLRGFFSGTLDVVQNPFDLGCREVGIDDQTGPLGEQLGPSPLTNVFANTLALA